MKKYKIDEKHFIGGWFIDPKICDDILKCYKKIPEPLLNNGMTRHKEQNHSNPDVKDSSDYYISPLNNKYPFPNYLKELQKCLNEYIKVYPPVGCLGKFGVTHNYNIQGYKKGGGFKLWHNERGYFMNATRVLVFMTFLNDVPDGGTDFKYQKITVPAKKGLTLIWPPDWTHTHKGQISQTKEKYIVTGWLNFLDDTSNT